MDLDNEPHSRLIDDRLMDLHDQEDDQVVPGEPNTGLPTQSILERRVSHLTHSTPMSMNPPLLRSHEQGRMSSPVSPHLGSVERDSGYISTPGTVSTGGGEGEQHFFSESDIDGSYIQRFSSSSVGDEDNTDGIKPGENSDSEITDIGDRLFSNDNDLECDNAELDTEEQAVFFIDDNSAIDSNNGQSISGRLSQQHFEDTTDTAEYLLQGSNLGNTNSSSHYNDEPPALLGLGSANIFDSHENRNIGHRNSQMLSSVDTQNRNSSNVTSDPLTIPNRPNRLHFLDHIQGNHNNVFHTPPRGYMVNPRARNSTGCLLNTLVHNPSRPMANTNARTDTRAMLDQAWEAHEAILNQNRHDLLNDEQNPRRSRFFSENYCQQENEQSDLGTMAASGGSGSYEFQQPIRRRDRSQSAPSIMTIEKFGQELRRISDIFDKEYSQNPCYRQPQARHRHGRNSDNRRSFPGTIQNEPGWWQKFIQWLPINSHNGHPLASHRTEPVLQHLVEEENEQDNLSDSGDDEVDGDVFPTQH